ncbi:MAG: hypothetical protein RMK32_01850 [Anaerolineae bacterium]|nr:hypothetical protein [Thermoflexus sp.]MDW8064359.1 hypothetical protein [Anaerolineae bacterium]
MEIFPEAMVLVAVVRNPRDWEWIRKTQAYRIPFRHAPSLTPLVDFVAFYHTAAFGPDRWSIRYYAFLRGHELVRRRDLFPEEPSHPRAGELYYLLQLGPLQPLLRPVVSRRWHRFTFLVTTGERLLQASDLSELPLQGIERRMFRGTLREEVLASVP